MCEVVFVSVYQLKYVKQCTQIDAAHMHLAHRLLNQSKGQTDHWAYTWCIFPIARYRYHIMQTVFQVLL